MDEVQVLWSMVVVPRDVANSRVGSPQLTIRCEYPDTSPPSVVTFGLSPSYGLLTARDAHEWFIGLVRERDELEVETDKAGELPFSFWSETVRRVVVE